MNSKKRRKPVLIASTDTLVPQVEGWVRGWTDILRYLHVRDETTIKRYKSRYNFPLHYLPDGFPVIIPAEVDAWLLAFNEEILRANKHVRTLGQAILQSYTKKQDSLCEDD